jgi:polyisoprenoid-binding protein YceI
MKLLAIFLAAGLVAAAAERLALGPGTGNRMALEVEKTGLMRGKKHVFRYEKFEGTVFYDGANSRVEFWVDATSAVCEDNWVDEKDRKKILAEALKLTDAARHPRLDFRSTAVRPGAAGGFEVEGQLTIRGAAKPVKVQVREKPGRVFEGTVKFPMSAWGIKPPSAALGAVGTKDEMTLQFTLAAR